MQEFELLNRQSFLVWWDGDRISGISRVSALERSIVADRKVSERPVPVEFVRACSADRAFELWADDPSPKAITIEVLNPGYDVALSFLLDDCVPISYVLLDPLDATSAEPALERLVVQCGSLRSNNDPEK
jgi:hypothetical protein